MGKSYKKSPVVKEHGRVSNKRRKQIASKAVRAKIKAGVEIGGGNEYRRHYESWDISDYAFVKTEAEARAEYAKFANPDSVDYSKPSAEMFPTEDDFMRWWRRHYKNK